MTFHAMTRLVALSWLTGVAACGQGVTEEGAGSARMVLDLRALVGTGAPIVDPITVLDTARLTVASEGDERRLALPLGQGDSTVSFDITAKTGEVRFTLDILSTNQTVLYQGDVTTTVDEDDFAVSITPQAVNPVMVIWPRIPPFTQINFGNGTFFVARWLFRNAGPDTLRWFLDLERTDGVVDCTFFPSRPVDPTTCLEQTFTVRSAEPDTVVVTFLPIGPGLTRTVTFMSEVGEASFATSVP
jgi:hypothetical protein